MSTIRIAQVTDTHLMEDREAQLRGVPTWHSLKAVLAAVTAAAPDVLLLTGDLADLAEPPAYGHLVELIRPLGIPTYAIPGNHDDPALLASIFGEPGSPIRTDASFLIDPWRVILLDSVLMGVSHGHLAEAELERLRQTLAADPERPTLVALHHNPVPIGSALMDEMGVNNAEDLFELIDAAPQVKLILFGHIHWEFHTRRGSVDIYGTPSSCKQLSPTGEFQSPDQTLPGFRVIDLGPNGEHHTQIRRAQFSGIPQPHWG